MYKTACPACGAQVEFRSAGSVMAVCVYCRSTLLRNAETVRNIGRMSEVIEDHTRIQITTSGQYEGKNFGVVGRIQLKYEDGFWNEWYVLFDDGSAGWLSDGSGQYVLTLPQGQPNKAPAFKDLRPNATLLWDKQRFTATDVRSALCVAGDGELPFQVGSGYVARVADFRCDERFLSLDYSDGDTPQAFLGVATTLEALKCQLLRSEDQVKDTAGKLQGKTKALECPNCGSGIDTIPGQAEHLVCPSCHAEVALTGDKAEVLKKHDELKQISTTLQLGDVGTFDGVKWQIIGLMRVAETGEEPDPPWIEYLLFNASKGFLWIVETNTEWTRTEVLNKLPETSGGSQVRLGGKAYTKKWSYGGEVLYAAGAFNWRVKIGDKTRITDYYGPDGVLSEEMTSEEVTWSLSRPVGAEQLAKAFGKPAASFAKTLAGSAPSSLQTFAKVASGILALLNAQAIFIEERFGAIVFVGLALLLLWLPVWMSGGTSSASDDDGDDD